MAMSITTTKSGINLGDMIKAPLRATGKFLSAVMDSASRAREIEELTALSDSQLARRGLERKDIVRHVFRDTIGV